MNRKRKILLLIVMTLICAFLLSISISALWSKKNQIPIPTVQKDVFVYDADNIIDEEIEDKINTLLIQLEEKTKAEIAVVTVTSLLDMEIEDYSYELANTLGIGKAEEDNGVLLLISKSDSRVRLEIGKGLEGCLNDSKCGRILDNYFVPYREKDEYSEGTYKTIEAVVSVIAQEYNTTIGEIDDTLADELDKQEAEEAKNTLTIFITIIIIIVIVCICDGIFLDGVILGSIFSSSSSSSGSFGGGFGGGSFGGGGASR